MIFSAFPMASLRFSKYLLLFRRRNAILSGLFETRCDNGSRPAWKVGARSAGCGFKSHPRRERKRKSLRGDPEKGLFQKVGGAGKSAPLFLYARRRTFLSGKSPKSGRQREGYHCSITVFVCPLAVYFSSIIRSDFPIRFAIPFPKASSNRSRPASSG